MTDSRTIRIVDTTLRDGEQAPGITFSHKDKVEIAERLADCGVNEIEAGIPAMGADEQAVIRDLLGRNLSADITVWCRARREDLDLAEACGAECVHMSFPASPVHLGVLGWTYAKVFKTMDELIPHAVSRFRFVSIGIQDVVRTANPMLIKMANRVYGYCANRIRLADSVGLWTPEAVRQTIQDMYLLFPGLKVGVHTHNDLGMATANAVSALQAGAHSVDTTVNGIGERAGNAALEQVVMALEVGTSLHTTIQTEKLYALCNLVAHKTEQTIPDNKPVIGANVFTHETGIHVHAQVQNRLAYEAYDPALVGRSGDIQVMIGKHSGTAAICYVMGRLGVRVTQKIAEKLLPRIRRLAERKHRNLYPNELLTLYESISSKRKYRANPGTV